MIVKVSCRNYEAVIMQFFPSSLTVFFLEANIFSKTCLTPPVTYFLHSLWDKIFEIHIRQREIYNCVYFN